MDPQAFMRVSVGSLGLRVIPTGIHNELSPPPPCVCEIRLPGFPVQTASIPFVSSPEATPDTNRIATRFYLQKSDVEALLAPGCFYAARACLEIAVFSGHKGSRLWGVKRQDIGRVKVVVGPEWGQGKQVILVNGWIGIGNNKAGVELHLRLKVEPDPRYVFQFEDKIKSSPQIVQVQGRLKQPIFSCKFSQGRVPQVGPLKRFWSSSVCSSDLERERRERKGWKVTIHDLSGSAVAAAYIATPFVPSSGCDWVARSNPGTWLIVFPDGFRRQSWQPWGKLEAWRERGIRDYICCRLHLLCDSQEHRDLLMTENLIGADRGGEFYIDTDKQARSPPALYPVSGGFVMSCRIQRDGRSSKPPFVQVAKRFVTCVEDAAIFMALSAAVDLSVEACKPFPRLRTCSW